MSKTSASPAETLDLDQLKTLLQEAYPAATEKLLSAAIKASLVELNGSVEPQRLIRCVCERITA